MKEKEAVAYIHSSPLRVLTTDEEWLTQIRDARAHVAAVRGDMEAEPEVAELEQKYKDYLIKLQATALFQESLVGSSSFKFASIELSRLRCLQGHLNLEYLNELIHDAPEPGDEDATIEFCLPLRVDSKGMEILPSAETTSNSLLLVSQNLNFRVAGFLQIEDQANNRKFTAVVYGFGCPQIQVVEHKGAYIIKNGHHRAFSLLKKGHRMAPCVLLSTEGYPHQGPPGVGMLSIESVMSERPPFLADFDSEAAIVVPRRRSVVKIKVRAEAQLVPI
jgi:hypothetical protein